MKSEQANTLFVETCKGNLNYREDRKRKLAHKVELDEVGAGIICRHVDYTARSAGRTATGAHATTSGGVWVNGRFILRSKMVPTCKAKGAKAHKAQRVIACDQAHTSTLDQARRFAYLSAPFRKGGAVYSNVSKAKRNRFRGILHKADGFLAAGEIAVALELTKEL